MTVHQSPITVNGWTGSGYSIIDPEYGVGVYHISGGMSGGWVSSDPIKILDWIGIVSEGFVGIFGQAFSKAIVELKGVIEKIITYISLITNCDQLHATAAISSIAFVASGLTSIVGVYTLINPFLGLFMAIFSAAIMKSLTDGWTASCR